MEIKEVINEGKDLFGDYWPYILGGFGILFVVMLLKGDKSEPVAVSGYIRYPDVDSNADVVISTLQNNLTATEERLAEQIGEQDDLIASFWDDVNVQFKATNDYINEGLENQEYIKGQISDMDDSIATVTKKVNSVSNRVSSLSGSVSSLSGSVSSLSGQVSGLQSSVNTMQENQAKAQASATTPITTTTSTAKSTPASTSTIKVTDMNAGKTIQYTTKAGLNTNTSIVDALKASGHDSSHEARAELYKANGGTGTYTGSYEQNVSMLNKLKAGQLKEA